MMGFFSKEAPTPTPTPRVLPIGLQAVQYIGTKPVKFTAVPNGRIYEMINPNDIALVSPVNAVLLKRSGLYISVELTMDTLQLKPAPEAL